MVIQVVLYGIEIKRKILVSDIVIQVVYRVSKLK